MTPHQTLTVAVRLFAIWLGLYAARVLLSMYLTGRERADEYMGLIATGVSILTIIIVIGLWFFPRTIARKLLPSPSDTPNQAAAPHTWFAVGASLIGLWLVATALPGLLRNFFVLYLFRSEAMETSSLAAGLVYLFVQVAAGAALIFGVNGAQRFFEWARYSGSE